MYSGTVTGTVNGGTIILGGQCLERLAGPLYSSWSDERCALQNADLYEVRESDDLSRAVASRGWRSR